MAFKTLSIRIPEEAHQELEKLAQERKQSVSDVARELLMIGLKGGGSGDNSIVLEYLEGFGSVLAGLHTEAARSRFYGELVTSYLVDMQSIMLDGKVMDAEAKDSVLVRYGKASSGAAQKAWLKMLNYKEAPDSVQAKKGEIEQI